MNLGLGFDNVVVAQIGQNLILFCYQQQLCRQLLQLFGQFDMEFIALSDALEQDVGQLFL